MSNQSLEEDLSYLCIKEVRQPGSPKLPPALQPRVRDGGGGRGVPIRPCLTQKPQPHVYRAVPAVYKPLVRPTDNLLPSRPYQGEPFFPPPPPPLVNSKMFQNHSFLHNDTFPLPPPPPECEDYDSDTLSSTYYQHTNYGEPHGEGDGNHLSYIDDQDYLLSEFLVFPQNSASNYANVQSSGAAAPSLHPSLPTHTYAPITPNTTPVQYTSRPAGPVNSGGYIHNPSSRTAHFEASAAPMPKSNDLGTLSRKSGKEAEVDALTNLLMQNIESAGDPDFFGMCAKCGRKVVGQSNGCTAMDQVFHINCFVCASCGNILRGKSFYAIETKPYCEPCYVNTLEKCSVCSKPVIDRLLRATGKPYHPACFTCVVCGMSLDGVPFTVDATNQIHCIEDFHRKFAPRCCVCQLPIMPDPGKEETVRVVAMDKSFHVQCYCCEDCGLLLSSEAEGRGCYPLDDHILCKHCNAKRIQALTTKMASEH